MSAVIGEISCSRKAESPNRLQLETCEPTIFDHVVKCGSMDRMY
jgi:hypothetical protein